ncbi:SWPV1-168 [Shearwaterpox virus]|uniref:mRNA-capping enzyme catalytic subunit n=1 Tax=Shearwaterpox virus TaxID=1974596 RepID=A0A1V0S7Z3_CNPV|nr:SWPV1-168 [Shearwaterpox virus]
MDNYILEKPLSYHFEELVDTFITAVKDVSEVDTSKHHEVEMQILKPSIITLNNLYDMATTTESYVEFTMIPIDKKNTKYRNRIPLSRIHGLDIKNSQLVENLDGFIWEEKTLIYEKKLSECSSNIKIRHSIEQKTLFVDYKRRNGSIRLELVSVVRAVLRNIVIDFKIKYFLGSGAQSASSLLYALNNPKNKPNLYLEFEISTSDKNISKQTLLKELNTAGNALFLSSVDKIRLCPRIKLVLQTHLIKKQEIINLNTDNLYVTSKTDGVFTYVLIKDKSIFCYFSHLGYIKEYTANRKLEIDEVYLYAEMRKDDNILYFIVIKVLTPEIEDRLDELKFVNDNLKNLHDRLIFITKCYEGPFETTSDLVIAIEEMLKVEHEGVILFYSNGEESSMDYKIKKDNTIDQCVNVIYRYMSSEPVIFSDSGPIIEYKRYSNDKDFPKEFATGKLEIGENVKYLNNIYCLEFKNLPPHTGVEKIVIPIKFIAEFSYNDKMIQPRIDKTMRYLYSEKYYGNQLSVIIDHLNDQKINIGDVFEEDKLAEVAHKQLKDSLRLNPQGNYFIVNKKRSALGVLSNYVKTLLISLYCSKAYLDDHSKRKVLAIDFGNGADLEKYFYGEIALMVATDPDESAIETGKKRYNNLNSRDKSKYYKFNYIQETIRSPTYVDSIREVLYFGKFSIVDWQFAIHYSFHPIHYSTVMKNLYELTESGCKVLISTMDGDYLDTLKEKKKFIIYKTQEIENYLSLEKIDDDKILVYNPSSMTKPMAEYIVRKDTLVRVFKEYQFSLIDTCSFKTVIDRSLNFIGGVSRLETRDSTKNFLELNRNALEDCKDTDVLELLDHYVVYVFSKN